MLNNNYKIKKILDRAAIDVSNKPETLEKIVSFLLNMGEGITLGDIFLAFSHITIQDLEEVSPKPIEKVYVETQIGIKPQQQQVKIKPSKTLDRLGANDKLIRNGYAEFQCLVDCGIIKTDDEVDTLIESGYSGALYTRLRKQLNTYACHLDFANSNLGDHSRALDLLTYHLPDTKEREAYIKRVGQESGEINKGKRIKLAAREYLDEYWEKVQIKTYADLDIYDKRVVSLNSSASITEALFSYPQTFYSSYWYSYYLDLMKAINDQPELFAHTYCPTVQEVEPVAQEFRELLDMMYEEHATDVLYNDEICQAQWDLFHPMFGDIYYNRFLPLFYSPEKIDFIKRKIEPIRDRKLCGELGQLNKLMERGYSFYATALGICWLDYKHIPTEYMIGFGDLNLERKANLEKTNKRYTED